LLTAIDAPVKPMPRWIHLPSRRSQQEQDQILSKVS